MRRSLSWSLTLLVLVASAMAVVAPGADPAATPPTLVSVRAGHHPGFDRVVFVFRGGLAATPRAAYGHKLLGGAPVLPIRIAGRAILQVSMSAAQAHDGDRPT